MSKAKLLLLAACALLAFFLAALDLWTGAAVVPWDAHDFFAPCFVALADSTRAGHLMLWNPWMAGGIPDYVEPQLGAFSPLMLAMGGLFGGTLLGFRFYFLTIWSLSGIGVFLLGRRLRAPVWGSVLIAFNWLFCGFLLGHAQHVSWIYSMGWLPFMVVVFDQALERGSWNRFAAAGAIWGLSLLGGYPGIVFNNTLLLAAWALGRTLFPAQGAAWASRPIVKRAGLALAGLLILALVGCAVMAPNLAGMLVEAVGVTSRAGAIPREAALGNNPLGWWCFSSLASPFLASAPLAKLWPRTDLSMSNVYVGALTLCLAFASLWTRRVARWGLFVGAILLFLVALGPATPLRGWLYDFVPFTRYFQHPAMYAGPAMFLLVVLALLGSRELDTRTSKRFRPALVAAMLSVGAWATLHLAASHAKVIPTAMAWTQLILAWLGTTLGLGLYAVLAPRRSRWRFLSAVPLVLSVFFDAYLCDKILVTHADRRAPIVASEKSVQRLHQDALNLVSLSGLNRAERVQGGLGVPGLSAWALVLKTPVFSGYTALRNTEQEAMAQAPSTRQLAVGSTKTWFSAAAVQAAPTAELFSAFMARSAAAGIPPLAIHQPDDFRHPRSAHTEEVTALNAAAPVVPLNAKLVHYSPTVLDLQVEAPQDGWLLVTDRWAPGWRAKVNGRAAQVYPADFVFRAVYLRTGTNKIEFRYQPSTLLPTLVLCWGMLIVVAFLQFNRGWLPRRMRRWRPNHGE